MHERENGQIRRSRVNIFLGDFEQAREFADYILSKRLHDVKGPYAKAKLVHLALNTSLIVSYSRPFHKSNEGAGLPRASLRQLVDGLLSGDERALHEKVIDKRDQALVHSDAAAHEFEGVNYDGRGMLFYKSAFMPLTKAESQVLRRMIKKWIKYLEELKARWKNTRINDSVLAGQTLTPLHLSRGKYNDGKEQ
jgi:hypothetical protein